MSFVLIGATTALTFTFVLLAFGWRRPRFDPAKAGRPLPACVTRTVDSPVVRWIAALAALLFTWWVAVATIVGPQDALNPLRGVFYVLLWVGLVALSLAIGPVWRIISPVRTVYRVIDVYRSEFGGRPARTLRYPTKWGYWPAAFGLFAFVWLELASPNYGTLTAIKVWLLGYVVVMMVGARVFGQRWFARADPFDVYSVVVSRLSPFRRNADTHLIVVGNPLDHLPSMPVRPGLLAVLAVLLGSTAFDSFNTMPAVENFIYDYEASIPLVSALVGGTLLRTTGLLLFIVVVAASFWTASQAAGGIDRQQRRRLPGQMAHSLIPIVVGYVFAHYLSYLVERGQETLILLADPLDRGWQLFGLDAWDANYWLSLHPAFLSTIKVSCVVAGQVLAVVAAHDKALRVLPGGHQLTGQLTLFLTMVGYSFIGLYLLFGA
ncbi:hypothetical protein M1248_30780 [Mycobacterium sp. 29Ha]|nr:hypothetical protein [Mycobacterium sp. 29Ha]MDV3136367.1 hypothetical protein [Mycobacterium sp. 29Ha]